MKINQPKIEPKFDAHSEFAKLDDATKAAVIFEAKNETAIEMETQATEQPHYSQFKKPTKWPLQSTKIWVKSG